MRRFQLLNVVKETNNEVVIDRLIAAGYTELDQETDNPDTELDREAIKAQLDAAGISYAKNAKTETLLEILEASKLGE